MLQHPTEEWKEIRQHKGYWVSNLGRVKTFWWMRALGDGGGSIKEMKSHARFLPQRSAKGYKNITIHDGRAFGYRVNRLVAEAFVPNPDNLPCVMHKNDKVWDNTVTNLCWGTNADNSNDMVAKGRQARGVKNNHAKLTDRDILVIRKDTRTQQEIADDYGVDRSAIGYIKAGVTWKHVD